MSESPYQSAHRMGETLNVWIYVDTLTDPQTAIGFVAPFWLPNGSFNVVWNLVTLQMDQGAPVAKFGETGIVLRNSTATRVDKRQEGRLSDTQYWMDLENFAQVEAALLGYDALLKDRDIRTVYDPTIIVSQDPILPPG